MCRWFSVDGDWKRGREEKERYLNGSLFSLSMVNDSKAQNSFEGGIIMARDFNGLKIKVAFQIGCLSSSSSCLVRGSLRGKMSN